MSADTTAGEGFLRRWARLKSAPAALQGEASQPDPLQTDPGPAQTARPEPVPAQAPAVSAQAAAPGRASPTLEDVARLTPDSDYSAFVAQGVDKAVQRMALKKLFADPNFAVMDGLDIYIADYNKASPLPDAMLATLRHAPGVLDRVPGEDEGAAQSNEGDAACAGTSDPAVGSEDRSEVRNEVTLDADRDPAPAADDKTATTPPQTLEPGTA